MLAVTKGKNMQDHTIRERYAHLCRVEEETGGRVFSLLSSSSCFTIAVGSTSIVGVISSFFDELGAVGDTSSWGSVRTMLLIAGCRGWVVL